MSRTTTQYSPKALEIIQRTNELLAVGGYNGFSYADIAELVEVRKASIHHHFPSKAELVKASPGPFERLVAYSRVWAECIERSSPPICICALLAAELPTVPAEVATEVRAHFDDLQAWIAATLEEGVAKGEMRLTDSPPAEAATYMASIHGAMLAARAAGDASLFWQIAKLATGRLKA